jgi:flagellar assembly protein FliH
MMSSSPEVSGVHAFEYKEPGGVEAAATNSATERRHQNSYSGQDAEAEFELKLAAARAEGFREGQKQAQQSVSEQIAEERVRVVEAIRAFVQQTSDYYSRAEIELVHLSLAIAAKILHREAQVDRMLVAALVKVAIEKLQQGTSATVRVRLEEVADWNRYFEGDGGGEIRVEVRPDSSVAAHNCILETELGTTELGLDVQLKEIEQGFFDLLAQRPDNK